MRTILESFSEFQSLASWKTPPHTYMHCLLSFLIKKGHEKGVLGFLGRLDGE